jgi:hypothetical protein
MTSKSSTYIPKHFSPIFLKGIAPPACSRLYGLEPTALGTPMVESLTSYIIRVASAHCVTVGALVANEIAPLIDKPYLTNKTSSGMSTQFTSSARAINGVGITSADWVNAMQSLTLRQEVRFLTMLPLKEMLTDNSLLRKSRAWCSDCYEEWQQKGKAIYEPLLWSISAVTACVSHKLPLRDKCARCNKQSPALPHSSRPGFCPHCNQWLGVAQGSDYAEDESLNEHQLEWQSWIVTHLGTVLTKVYQAASSLKRADVTRLIHTCIRRSTRGDLKAFIRRFSSFNYSTMHGWLSGNVLPELERLMQLCYQTEVSMKDVLFGRLGVRDIPPKYVVIRSKDSYYITDADINRMDAALRLILDEYPPPSPHKMSKRLGCHILTIKQHLPELFSLAQERYSAFKAERFDRKRMQSSLSAAIEEYPPPSLSSMAKRLGCSRALLRLIFPEDCRLIVKRHLEFRMVFANREDARIQLEAFQSEFPPLSVIQCTERLICSRSYLEKNFPELCHAIAIRYYNYSQELVRQRREQRQTIIIEVYTAIKAEGINPSSYQIKKRLPQMCGITNREIDALLSKSGTSDKA